MTDDKTCGQSSCNNRAQERMFWPGRDPVPICETCKAAAENIANAMGFYLYFEALLDEGNQKP